MRLLCNPEEKNVGALQGGSEKTRSGLTLPSLSGCQPVTAKHWSGNWFTLRRGLTVFGSLDPSPRVRRFPFGCGLQSILHLPVSSVCVGAFSTSKIDNGDGPGCSSGSDTLVATFPWSDIVRAYSHRGISRITLMSIYCKCTQLRYTPIVIARELVGVRFKGYAKILMNYYSKKLPIIQH